jgi:hypothetical protein
MGVLTDPEKMEVSLRERYSLARGTAGNINICYCYYCRAVSICVDWRPARPADGSIQNPEAPKF